MSISLLLEPFSTFWDDTGSALASTIEVYNAGTSTLSSVYSDTSSTPLTNPVSLTAGRTTIYATDGYAYKIVLKDSSGNTLKTEDNVTPRDGLKGDLASTASGKGAELVAYNQGGTGAADTTVEAKLQEFVSVKDFGATGDGVTDDTAAIQAAIDYVWNNLDTESTVYFPGGVYLISSTIDWKPQVNLVGFGKPYGFCRDVTTIKLADSSNTDMLTTSATNQNSGGQSLFGHHAYISGIHFDCNRTGNTSGNGITLSISNVTLERVNIREAAEVGLVVSASGATYCVDTHVTNCVKQNVVTTGSDIIFNGCEFQNADIGNTSTYPNVLVKGNHNRFTDCRFGMDNSTGTDGIQLGDATTAASFTKINNCIIQNNTRHGIYSLNSSKDTVTNNTFVGNGDNCLHVLTSYMVISGNMCDATAGNEWIEIGDGSHTPQYINAFGNINISGSHNIVAGSYITLNTHLNRIVRGTASITITAGNTDATATITPNMNTADFAAFASITNAGGTGYTIQTHAVAYNTFKITVEIPSALGVNATYNVEWVAVGIASEEP